MPKRYSSKVVRFRAEFFALDRETYFRTSEGENGKSKQNFMQSKKPQVFYLRIAKKLLKRTSFVKAKKLSSFLFAFMPKCDSPRG